jgi:ADP-ribose pyrophosphatase YjhB (NUDIX family)
MISKDLPANDWALVQSSVPIACVDALPLRHAEDGAVRVGLILRNTPDQGQAWCLIGGRVGRDVPLVEAMHAELRDALGDEIRFSPIQLNDAIVVEYLREPSEYAPYDPRQHSIATTFAVWCEGEVVVSGTEAQDFSWFDLTDIDGLTIGFGQRHAISRVLARAGLIR